MTQDGLWAAAVAADVSCARAAPVQRQIRLTKAARAMQRCGDVMLRAVNCSLLATMAQDDSRHGARPGGSINAAAFCTIVLGAPKALARSVSISAAVSGSTSNCALSASARNSPSVIVASKARRNAARRSAGTPGGAAKGRPASCRIKISSSTCLLSTSATRSSALGTCGRSGSLVRPIWTMTLRSLSLIQCGRDALMVDQDKPQIPSASPRSTASVKPAPVSYPAITLNLVPTSAFNVLGTIAVFEVAPAAATMTSRVRAAAMVLICDRCQVAQTFCNLPMLPSQPNFCTS